MECRADMPGNATGGHLFISCLFCVCVWVGGGGSTTNAKLVLKRTSVNKAGFDASLI